MEQGLGLQSCKLQEKQDFSAYKSPQAYILPISNSVWQERSYLTTTRNFFQRSYPLESSWSECSPARTKALSQAGEAQGRLLQDTPRRRLLSHSLLILWAPHIQQCALFWHLLGTAAMVVSIQLHTAPGEGIPAGTSASRGAGGRKGWHGSRGRARPRDTRP